MNTGYFAASSAMTFVFFRVGILVTLSTSTGLLLLHLLTVSQHSIAQNSSEFAYKCHRMQSGIAFFTLLSQLYLEFVSRLTAAFVLRLSRDQCDDDIAFDSELLLYYITTQKSVLSPLPSLPSSLFPASSQVLLKLEQMFIQSNWKDVGDHSTNERAKKSSSAAFTQLNKAFLIISLRIKPSKHGVLSLQVRLDDSRVW